MGGAGVGRGESRGVSTPTAPTSAAAAPIAVVGAAVVGTAAAAAVVGAAAPPLLALHRVCARLPALSLACSLVRSLLLPPRTCLPSHSFARWPLACSLALVCLLDPSLTRHPALGLSSVCGNFTVKE
jgi:hypothetical protein